MMHFFLEISLGLGLAAACGFRVFLPLLVLSVSAHNGQVQLGPEFQWLATTPALVVLSTATILEVLGYYFPFVDNALDAVATPAATLAGTLATAAILTDLPPAFHWALAAIAGGGLATGIQVGTVKARALASMTTLGTGNAVLSTAENGTSASVALVAVLFPFLALGFLTLTLLTAYFLLKRRQRAPAPA
jgi:hypothetical protein